MTLFGMYLGAWLAIVAVFAVFCFACWCVGFLRGEAQGNQNCHQMMRISNGLDEKNRQDLSNIRSRFW